MTNIESIRKLYMPIQPTVKQSAKNVSYAEFIPDSRLENFIYCYWELKTSEPLEQAFNYRVIADGCIDIFFELNHPEDNFVMGFCKKYTQFPIGNSFHYIGIRFLPSMFPQLFKIDAAELSNKFERLEFVLPDTSKFIERHLQNHLSFPQIKTILDHYFVELIAKISFDFDPRFYDAVNVILKKSGVVDLKKDLNTGISARQLRRLFQYYIGDSAKTFSQVVRFQNIFRAKPSSQSLRENKLFFGEGYYDQSHFIKEFRNFYGVTPSQAFNK